MSAELYRWDPDFSNRPSSFRRASLASSSGLRSYLAVIVTLAWRAVRWAIPMSCRIRFPINVRRKSCQVVRLVMPAWVQRSARIKRAASVVMAFSASPPLALRKRPQRFIGQNTPPGSFPRRSSQRFRYWAAIPTIRRSPCLSPLPITLMR